MLEMLRKLNPGLPFYSVEDAAFRRFGRVIDYPAQGLIEACRRAVQMPESGSRYAADLPELETPELFEPAARMLRGEGSCQIGCCWGYNTRLNCLEYHRASEHNIAVTDMVLLLAAQQELEDGRLDTGKIAAFCVPAGTVIEVYATTLHFCPCQVSDEGFVSIVILPRGTNRPLERPRGDAGEGRLLWAKDKWLIAHPEAPAVQRGAFPGLHGVNHEIRYEHR